MPCQNHPGVHDGLVLCWRCRREYCRNCLVELQEYWFCPECKPAQVRDILAGTDMGSLDFAEIWQRVLAAMIDGFLKGIVSSGFNFMGTMMQMGIMASTPQASNATAAGIGLAVYFFFVLLGLASGVVYEAIMHSRNKGQTLGKMALNIRVVTATGGPISVRQSWWRAALKMLINMAFCFCCGMGGILDFLFALGFERASLHDMLAQTRVIKKD